MNTRWMPTAAGILDIICGAISMLGSLIMALVLLAFFAPSYGGSSGQEIPALVVWLLIFLPYFIISLLAVIGGIFALRRKVWGLALAGSICSLLTLWSWPLGVTSLVLVSLSREEFKRPAPLFPASVISPSAPPSGS